MNTTCKWCKETIPKLNAANHVRWCHSNPTRVFKQIEFKSNCNICGTELIYPRRRIRCDEHKHTTTDDLKQLMSEKRIEFLKNNPDKHPWKRIDKFLSAPCEKVKEYLASRKISYVEEYTPLTTRQFSIDIAFPDLKIGVEINGNQHYNRDGTLAPYYQERHNLIEDAGWKLIEVHYTGCFNDKNLDLIFKHIELNERTDYTFYFDANKRKKRNHRTRKEYFASRRLKEEEKWNPFIILVAQSDIVFSKFGWVVKVSAILGIKQQCVNRWMKRYMLDFYEQKCFKRKSSVSPHRSSKPLT